MPIIPKRDQAAIEYCERQAQVWLDHAAELGLSPDAVAELDTLTEQARVALEAAQASRQAAISATLILNSRIDAMRRRAQALLGQIKATAGARQDPRVLATAQVPARKPRTRLAPPGKPNPVNVRLLPDGSLRLSWMSGNAAPSTGAFFRVKRRLDGERHYRELGGTPVREFTDETIPVGTRGASYIVIPCRGRREGVASMPIGVTFGRLVEQGVRVRRAA